MEDIHKRGLALSAVATHDREFLPLIWGNGNLVTVRTRISSQPKVLSYLTPHSRRLPTKEKTPTTFKGSKVGPGSFVIDHSKSLTGLGRTTDKNSPRLVINIYWVKFIKLFMDVFYELKQSTSHFGFYKWQTGKFLFKRLRSISYFFVSYPGVHSTGPKFRVRQWTIHVNPLKELTDTKSKGRQIFLLFLPYCRGRKPRLHSFQDLWSNRVSVVRYL